MTQRHRFELGLACRWRLCARSRHEPLQPVRGQRNTAPSCGRRRDGRRRHRL